MCELIGTGHDSRIERGGRGWHVESHVDRLGFGRGLQAFEDVACVFV